MAAVPAHRVPFGELGHSRLQSLSSAKNCQNAITDLLNSDIKGKPLGNAFSPPPKRALPTSAFDDAEPDTENIDPSIHAKRSKGWDGTASKKPSLFTLSTDTAKPSPSFDFGSLLNNAYAAQPTSPLKRRTPAAPSPLEIPNAPASAPAGRSPKHKRIGILSRKRASFSPVKRINPPSFGGRDMSASGSQGLPFSLDAALNGTFAHPAPRHKVATLEESMPKGWFFAIHEDTPDEEAANMMEHSTCILDISSDDEEGPSCKKDERGKENIPPSDHVTRVDEAILESKPRRSVHVDAMADVGEERAPLGEMTAEDFYGAGLDASSVEVLASDVATTVDEPCKANVVAAAEKSFEQYHPISEEERSTTVQDENISPVTPDSPTLLPLPTCDLLGHSIDKPDFVIAEDPATP